MKLKFKFKKIVGYYDGKYFLDDKRLLKASYIREKNTYLLIDLLNNNSIWYDKYTTENILYYSNKKNNKVFDPWIIKNELTEDDKRKYNYYE